MVNMDYDFFLSYTRADDDPYLQRFFKELSEEVRIRLGHPLGTRVGFFDQSDIELGSQWKEEIVDALLNSKVLVCLYSPAYFKSPYCGREWQLFHLRRARYLEAQRAAGEVNARLPPVIKPVIWIPPVVDNEVSADDDEARKPASLPETIDKAVREDQYTLGKQSDLYNVEGLRYVLKRGYKQRYNDYVVRLAKQIIQAGSLPPLPALGQAPSLLALEPAFPIQPAASSRHVRFVFVAADPKKLGNERSPEPYLETGGYDWKPYYPAKKISIGDFVHYVATQKELGFTSDNLPFNRSLRNEIKTAWKDGKIVVLLVDGWTLSWDQKCRSILKELDEKGSDANYSVIVPWNDDDPELVANRAQIEQVLADTFGSLARGSVYYKDSVRSPIELQEALREVLIRIKAEIRNRKDAVRPLPPATSAPMVSATETPG